METEVINGISTEVDFMEYIAKVKTMYKHLEEEEEKKMEEGACTPVVLYGHTFFIN